MSVVRLGAAFLRRDAATALSYRLPFVLGVASTLFVLALFFYLGKLIGDAGATTNEGLQRGYFAYAVLGLALLEIVQVGLLSFGHKMRQEQTTGTFEVLMSAPASPRALIAASVAYDLLRATISALFLLAVAIVVFGLRLDTAIASLLAAAGGLLACLFLFAALGIALAAFTVVFKQVTALLAMVVTGLALLGGVYFPIDLMPQPLQALGHILPFTWGLETIRSALINGNVDGGRLAALAGSALVAWPLALALFSAALNRARRDGSLAQY